MKKRNDGRKTGAAGQQLTSLDNIVLDIIGQDSAYLQGLHQNDEAPVLPQNATIDHNSNQHNSSIFSNFESQNQSSFFPPGMIKTYQVNGFKISQVKFIRLG